MSVSSRLRGSDVFATGDPIIRHLESLVERLEAGDPPRDIEDGWVEAKEEPGRRRGRQLQPGRPTNDRAATALAEHAACFANGPTGGAILVGIADDGTAIGTELDVAWLRGRIGELTQGELYPYVSERTVLGVRCLVLHVHPAPIPIKVGGQVRMRVGDECVPVPATHWTQVRVETGMFDWSADRSGTPATEVSAAAMELARRFLRESGETGAADLARTRDADLLGRLGVVAADGLLTNAGALLLCPTGRPILDYLHRERAGAPSRVRVESGDISGIEQFSEIMTAIRLATPSEQLLDSAGTTVGTFPALPERARREAVVNAIAHRDWLVAEAVTVELTGTTLVVSSPGRLVGGVTPQNIITHPSVRRSPHLTEVLAKLRLAEREAVGVDTMFLEMLRDGHPTPDIEETADSVRVALAGGHPDTHWVRALLALDPVELRDDLNAALLLDHVCRTGFVTSTTGAPVLQRSVAETRVALRELASATVRGTRVLEHVDGDPDHEDPALQLRDSVDLGPRMRGASPELRTGLLRGYVLDRGRITTRAAMALTRATRPTALSDLQELVDEGVLVPAGAGPTAHHVLASDLEAVEEHERLDR